MSRIEQGPSNELSKREALNQALAGVIGKVRHPLSADSALEAKSILTRPLTKEDAKAIAMITRGFPQDVAKAPILASRDIILLKIESAISSILSPFANVEKKYKLHLQAQQLDDTIAQLAEKIKPLLTAADSVRNEVKGIKDNEENGK